MLPTLMFMLTMHANPFPLSVESCHLQRQDIQALQVAAPASTACRVQIWISSNTLVVVGSELLMTKGVIKGRLMSHCFFIFVFKLWGAGSVEIETPSPESSLLEDLEPTWNYWVHVSIWSCGCWHLLLYVDKEESISIWAQQWSIFTHHMKWIFFSMYAAMFIPSKQHTNV